MGWRRVPNARTRYDIISLNYDLVLEKVCDFLSRHYQAECLLHFQRAESDTSATELGLPWLAKLHGSADSPDDIIPPTWNKALDESIKEQWKAAHHLLSEANHIRILGYSLPSSDTYVQYLLKSSIVRGERQLSRGLESFHVVTLDSDGKTQERYEGLVKFKGFRFVSKRIEEYLQFITPEKVPGQTAGEVEFQFTTLEDAHKEFMDRAEFL